MTRIELFDIAKHQDQEVQIQGWVASKRSSGDIQFIQIRDGFDFIQCIVEKSSVTPEVFDACDKLTLESSVRLTGTVHKHPKQVDEFELHITQVESVGPSVDFPISKKEHGPDFLLDHRHLWLRSKRQWAIQRVRNTIIYATYEFFEKKQFIKIDAPILSPVACEGTTELFGLDYFDLGKAYLSQSGQLYIEAAIYAFGRVFDFGPVFRAEKSKTRRHLTEFWMMDAEMAWFDHEQNMKLQEDLVEYIVKCVLERNQKELKALERNIKPLESVKAPFHRMTHEEAVKKLKEMGSSIGERDDLGAADETMLTQNLDKPLFVEQYPREVKAFYMKRNPNDPTRVLNADLLAPEGYGEVIGGSQREENYDTLLAIMKEQKMPIEPFSWYLDLRKYGSVPHAGFGYGLERLTAWICGLHHIRETIPFPRIINRLYP